MVFNHPNIYSELSHARRSGRQLACRVVSPSLTERAHARGCKGGDLAESLEVQLSSKQNTTMIPKPILTAFNATRPPDILGPTLFAPPLCPEAFYDINVA
jgi:hypothetical protein